MKTLCIILGSISLALGILGIFLPLLPTTPFLLLTAALYFKGSPRLYNWLLNHRHFGPYIRNFRENKAIPLRAKVISLVLMWGTMLYCIFFLIPLLWVKILLGLIDSVKELLDLVQEASSDIARPTVAVLNDYPLSGLKVDDGFSITTINAYLSLLEDIEPKIDHIVTAMNQVDLPMGLNSMIADYSVQIASMTGSYDNLKLYKG